MIEAIKTLLTSLTLLSNITFVAILIVLLLKKKKLLPSALLRYTLQFAFAVALTAMLGSLFYSEMVGLTPCKLCWYQRILVYPQVLLLGLALYFKDNNIRKYLIPMNILNLIVAGYHYFLQWQSASSPFCILGESCTSNITFSFGYISIPFMSFSASALILLLLYVSKK